MSSQITFVPLTNIVVRNGTECIICGAFSPHHPHTQHWPLFTCCRRRLRYIGFLSLLHFYLSLSKLGWKSAVNTHTHTHTHRASQVLPFLSCWLELWHTGSLDSGPAVLLLHGFPETSYSWRHQMSSLAGAGFHVIAPDMRGYGASDAPESSEEYTSLHIVGDIIGLLDTFNLKEVRIILYAYSWKLIDSDSCLSLVNLETSRNRFKHHSWL